MSSYISEEYRKIFDDVIVHSSEGVILRYDIYKDVIEYQPMSHNADDDGVQRLGELMRKNLFFYCYGEEEVVERYGDFKDADRAARFAYIERLPKRDSKMDGLLGEVLLDLLIQLFEKDTYKLAVRTKYRQNNNMEIKGYDLTYFTSNGDDITIWLGQAKTGKKYYCKSDIEKDLLNTFNKRYLSRQLLFICDKATDITKEGRKIVNMINKLNSATFDSDETNSENSLLDLFRENNISINIPCLLAYDEAKVYTNPKKLGENIINEVKEIRGFFSKKRYEFEGFNPKIILYIFPIKDLEKLRDKEVGFYYGLC